MPEEVQSRFTVYERPDASPGRCIVCGATQRPVVDFGVDVEWADNGYGRAYFCEYCIKQAASKFPEPKSDDSAETDYENRLASDRAWIANELRNLADRYNLGVAVPVYGSADSVPEQTEPADTSDNESFVQRDEPKIGRLVVKTDDSIIDEDSAGVPGSTGDGKPSIFG